MLKRVAAAALAVLGFIALDSSVAFAQSSDQYNKCVAWAQQQSGYYGATPNQAQYAPLKGAAAGALGGALIGGMGGGDAGRGAGIGAAFGLVAGGVRKREAKSSQQNAQNNFYNDLNVCLSPPPG
jgi:outer membrane lipoprotein SlyB